MEDRKQELQRLFPQVKEAHYPRLMAIFTIEDPVYREKLLNAYLDEVQESTLDKAS